MPQLGETVIEGTIIGWSKQVGDEVAVDDALFEVSTEKVDTEVPAAVAGYLRAVLVDEGATVAIGTPIAVITPTPTEEVVLPDTAAVSGSVAPVRVQRQPGVPTDNPANGHARGERGRPAGGNVPREVLSPAVRRLLGEHRLRPVDVAGSGRGGRITRADVVAVAAQKTRSTASRAPSPTGPGAAGAPTSDPDPIRAGARSADAPADQAPGPAEVDGDHQVVELSRARRATAERLVASLATAAHALVVIEVDYHGVEPVRRAHGLSYLPFVARALVDALGDFPNLNASLDGDRLIVHRRVDLGVAVDVDRKALVVPVVRGVDGLRLPAIAAQVATLADRARHRRLVGDALVGATITITNVGSHGTLATAPIIDQPQVAICSIDGVRMAPVAVRTDQGGVDEPAWGVGVHPLGNLSLSFDHRAVDGAYAAAFLDRVRTILETRDWHQEVVG